MPITTNPEFIGTNGRSGSNILGHTKNRRLTGNSSLLFTVSLILFTILTYAAYYVHAFFSLVIWIPFFQTLVKTDISLRALRLFIFILVFNIVSSFWLSSISLPKGVSIWVANSLLMYLPVAVCLLLGRRLISNESRITVLIICWIAFEMLHHQWRLNWPWLSLGNNFGSVPKLVQWYQYTGMLGGTAWILLTSAYSLIVFDAIALKKTLILTAIIMVPIAISLWLITQEAKKEGMVEVYIVQPNAGKGSDELRLLDSVFAKVKVTPPSSEAILFLTETFLKERTSTDAILDSRSIIRIKRHLKAHPNISVLTGILLSRPSEDDEAILDSALNLRYDLLDAIMKIDTSQVIVFRSKSKLIPVEEYKRGLLKVIPFESDDFTPGEGVHSMKINRHLNIVPVICFELLFGNDIARAVSQDVGLIAMIGNEQLLKSSHEKEYYTNIARLRAIENQKYLIKASNKGKCCIISPTGQITIKMVDDKFGVLKCVVPNVKHQSFYTHNVGAIEIGIYLIFLTTIIGTLFFGRK